ncbi:MAG: alpha/beta hydrolase family protein [Candidatus Heimdallarchaeota archaeon]
MHGWLYKPKKTNGKTIIYVHGGPTYHSSDEINHQIQYYSNQGFLVLDPNYRGSTGYGVAFEDSIKDKGWGADEQNDIIAGVEQLISDGLATRNKIGMTGTSYGGYSSWFAITKNPKEIIAATAPICGMTDLVVDYETTRPKTLKQSKICLMNIILNTKFGSLMTKVTVFIKLKIKKNCILVLLNSLQMLSNEHPFIKLD